MHFRKLSVANKNANFDEKTPNIKSEARVQVAFFHTVDNLSFFSELEAFTRTTSLTGCVAMNGKKEASW